MGDSATQDKTYLRVRYRDVRSNMDPAVRAEIDSAISFNLWETEEYKRCSMVLSYASFGEEADTLTTFVKAWEDGKTVAVPRCIPAGHRMVFYAISSLDDLARGHIGLSEPSDDRARQVSPTPDSICITPALCYDRKGHRLGYGGGYYDRFLSGFPGTSIGLCRAAQLSEIILPQDELDIPVDLVVTEKEVIRPR